MSGTLEFISGGITGTVTMEEFPDPIRSPNVPALSWHITTPLGVTWDSTNPAQGSHENRNFGGGLILHPELGFTFDTTVGKYALIITDGPTNLMPDMRTGAYTFETFAAGRDFAMGAGEWRLVSNAVPIPAMLWLWPTVMGLIGLAGLVAWRRQVY